MEESTGETIIHTIVPATTRNTLTGSLTPHNCKYTPKTTSDITFAGPRPPVLHHAPAQNSQRNMTDTKCICRVFVFEHVLLEME